MTREEAIKIFNTVLFLGKCDCPKEEIEECLKMAIKALEQEPTTKNSLGVDAISRQAAIDAIRRIHPVDTDYDCTLLDKVDVMYVLNELPSVTPQEPKIFPIAEIKYDKDKLKELVNKAVLTVAPQEPQIFKWCDTCREYDQEKHCCHRWSKVIRDTVEEMKQEPKTGHWREDIDNNRRWDRVRFYCSECGDWQIYGKTHYCPNCGCRMVEAQESEGKENKDEQ